MFKRFLGRLVVVAAIALAAAVHPAYAQLDETASWTSFVTNEYRVVPNVTYLTAEGQDNRVDLYLPQNADAPTPVLMYIHGGGWRGGSKESSVLRILPYLEMGWAVVNVQYRLTRVSQAPAAVEDCLCALRWIIRNAEEHNFDTSRIVVTGQSAGGHLTLTTGMTAASAGLDRRCPGDAARGGHDQLVRRDRRGRPARRSQYDRVGRILARQPRGSHGARRAGLAVDLRP